MDGRPLDNSSRTFSASSLREKLTNLTSSPLRPVVALHASIDFVPTKIPRKRRFQTLAVAVWSTTLVLSISLFLYMCSIPAFWPFIAVYLVWMSWIDKSPEHGTRLSPWFRSLRIWQYFAEYYPASCECDLPPDRPYVFGYHPHGSGALATFATEATGFSSAFPGIRPHLLTLTNNFDVPIYREILMALGISSVSKRSCSNILKRGPGEAITIVVGGATESLSAHPGTADLTLRRRLGFIKVAIQHGADLVPVFSFGENDIYQQMPNEKGTTIYALQKRFQGMFGFTLPLFHGRGLLNYNLGLLPYRRRIVSVIGRPIHTEKCEKPTLDEITHVQTKYIKELTRIWNAYKDEFAKSRTRELSIID
ncbi:diacylglycerol acyltransferase-domain-containing protein [Scleroderma citrinum]